MMTTDFDAIVVGSGISGGWAAKELTEKGLKTLVLERGREIEHIRDYQGEHQPPWQYEFRNYGDRKLYERDYSVQSRFGWFDEYTRQFWNNDPFTGCAAISWVGARYCGAGNAIAGATWTSKRT
jgi:choline dehydrogenase-like flavoprotein